MWVKICGTTSLEDAQLAIDAGADSVGFVFAESKRKVSTDQVAAITRELTPHVERTGVFHSHTPGEIIASVREAGLTSVQMHRRFRTEDVRAIRAGLGHDIKLLQVISCSTEQFHENEFKSELRSVLLEPAIWGILLDASRAGVSGGTGQSFNWAQAAAVLDEVWPERSTDHGVKLILAGGLRPENVREAIVTLCPAGVDVVSGVEAEPGKKDAARVKAFIDSARSA